MDRDTGYRRTAVKHKRNSQQPKAKERRTGVVQERTGWEEGRKRRRREGKKSGSVDRKRRNQIQDDRGDHIDRRNTESDTTELEHT